MFGELIAEGYQIDFFCHFWSPDRMFPAGPVRKSDRYNSFIPTESRNVQNELIRYLKPKQMIFSEYSQMSELKSYKFVNDTEISYVGFVNLNAQFFGFQRMIDTIDFSDYDFVLKWRYDILGHHDKKYVDGITRAIDHCINYENSILFSNESDNVSSIRGVTAVEDPIYGVSTKSLSKFSDFVEFMSFKTDVTHCELKLAQFAQYKKLAPTFTNYVYTFIRPYSYIDNNLYEEDITKLIDRHPQSKLPLHLKHK